MNRVARMTARYGIYLWFDADTEQRLQSLREKLAAEVENIPPVEGKMRPHLTLLVFDAADFQPLLESFADMEGAQRAFPLMLDAVGVFAGKRQVLYIKPVLSPQLQECFQRCHEQFANTAIVPHYGNPARWHPHVTLAKHLDARAMQRARAIADQEWKPVEAGICGIGLINVRKPLEILACREL